MAELFVLFSQMEVTKSTVNKIRNDLKDIIDRFNATTSNLDWDIKSEHEINQKIRALLTKMQSIEIALRTHVNFLEHSQNTYTRLEKGNEEALGEIRLDSYRDASANVNTSDAKKVMTDLLPLGFLNIVPGSPISIPLQSFGLIPAATRLFPNCVKNVKGVPEWQPRDSHRGMEWDKIISHSPLNSSNFYEEDEKLLTDELKSLNTALHSKELGEEKAKLY